MDTVQDFFKLMPPVTRALFISTLVTTLAGNYGLVSPMSLVLTTAAVTKFQLWRFVTTFVFFGKLSFGFLMHLYFLYNYSKSLETEHFVGRTADYVFFLTFVATILNVVGYLLEYPVLCSVFGMSILYVWSQIFRDTTVSFFFGLQFKAIFLPWVLVGFDILLGQSPFSTLIGIAVGHLYYYLQFVHPLNTGTQLLTTPAFMYDWFPNQAIVAGVGVTPQGRPINAPPAGTGGRYNWGQGHRLDG